MRTEVGKGEDGGEKRLPDKSSKPVEPTNPPDEAKATRDQGLQPATSASARSTSHDHPGKDAMTMDPPRPSEDPADVMGDDKRCPDTPTEPPNKPLDKEVEGTRVEGSEVETAMAEVSRDIEESPGIDGNEERRPGWPDGPPDKPYGAPRDPNSVQVEPGGETVARRNQDVAHGDADAGTDGSAEEAHGDVQSEVARSGVRQERSIEGERGIALARTRSTTAAEDNNQRPPTDNGDIPEDPPDPSPPPDNPAYRQNEPPSVESIEEHRGHQECGEEAAQSVGMR